MKRFSLTALAAAALAFCAPAAAQDLLIRNARVHTGTAQNAAESERLETGCVLVSGGVVREVSPGHADTCNRSAMPGVEVIDAGGRHLTPTLFGGITGIGLEEVSAEESTVDASLAFGAETKQMVVRPEFDVTFAYNPASVLVPVNRIEGIGWTLLGAGSPEGGSIVGGQGGTVRLDGSADPIGDRVLFVQLGGGASGLSGKSRAAQWMLLDQLVDEARGRIPADANAALLTPAGRRTLLRYLDGGGRVMVDVDRAADIRQLLRWSRRQNVRIAIAGGAEAWPLASEIAAAKVPVFVDPLANLPSSFDAIHSSFQNAARLAAAGVQVGFTQGGDASHNARKIRQLAGNAVAHGLPWEKGLAGLTSVPAQALGLADQAGRIAVGQRADLVLWSGDPLEVNAVALQVWMNGRAVPMRSRQTELRDRYLRPQPPREQGGLPRAYPASAEQ
ncbi:amidohydrolase family protein [Marilutibacter chinensis]|uniref:Amidohydrolase family protein n=1 Tax=Marilutibacter chinensis TaxID=2912247 RepID=A0ABS9HTF3_9GAMM|nr:amidohydrolase family protein [Lysobacter chinensis]MCF7222181.1 amidohydrolase family protein [Lysobacter chinensis]